MKITLERIELSKTSIITFVVRKLVEEYNIASEEALIRFMKTHTYVLLQNNKSKLYLESPEYVLDMLHNELIGNTEEWLKI